MNLLLVEECAAMYRALQAGGPFEDGMSDAEKDQKMIRDMRIEETLRDEYLAQRRVLDERRERLIRPMALRLAIYDRRERDRAQRQAWRYRYLEYEIFVCEQAGILMGWAMGDQGIYCDFLRAASAWSPAEAMQKLRMLSREHTANSLRVTFDVARAALGAFPMTTTHGALAAIVGCEEYGCHTAEGGTGASYWGSFPPSRLDLDEYHVALPEGHESSRAAIVSPGAIRRVGIRYRETCECRFCQHHCAIFRVANEPVAACRCGTCLTFEWRQRAERSGRPQRSQREEMEGAPRDDMPFRIVNEGELVEVDVDAAQRVMDEVFPSGARRTWDRTITFTTPRIPLTYAANSSRIITNTWRYTPSQTTDVPMVMDWVVDETTATERSAE